MKTAHLDAALFVRLLLYEWEYQTGVRKAVAYVISAHASSRSSQLFAVVKATLRREFCIAVALPVSPTERGDLWESSTLSAAAFDPEKQKKKEFASFGRRKRGCAKLCAVFQHRSHSTGGLLQSSELWLLVVKNPLKWSFRTVIYELGTLGTPI